MPGIRLRSLDEALEPLTLPPAEMCDIGRESAETCLAMAHGRPTVLLLGNSQMLLGSNGLASFVDGRGALALRLAAGQCGAFLGVGMLNGLDVRAECIRSRQHGTAELSRDVVKPEMAILYTLWPGYGPDVPFAPAGSRAALRRPAPRLRRCLARDAATAPPLRHRAHAVIGPTPIFARPVPDCLHRAAEQGKDWLSECGITRARFEERTAAARDQIIEAIAGLDGVRLVDPAEDFCDAGHCYPYADGKPLFTDIHHPADGAMLRIVQRHSGDFDWLLGGQR